MENIVQIQYIISAFIGFGSAVIVAIIAGIFQSRIAKKIEKFKKSNLRSQENNFLYRWNNLKKNMLRK